MAIKKQKLLNEQDFKKKIDKARNNNKPNTTTPLIPKNNNKEIKNVEAVKTSYFKYILYFIFLLIFISIIVLPKPKTFYYTANGQQQKSIFLPNSLFNESKILDSTYFDKVSFKQIDKNKFLVFCSTNKKLKCQQYTIHKEDSIFKTISNIIEII